MANTVDEFIAACLPIREALAKAFDSFNDDGDVIRAYCCGQQVTYSSGICGTDMSRCLVCGSEIRMILSPHVSPILLSNGSTSIPSEELIRKVGEKCWCWKRSKPSITNAATELKMAWEEKKQADAAYAAIIRNGPDSSGRDEYVAAEVRRGFAGDALLEACTKYLPAVLDVEADLLETCKAVLDAMDSGWRAESEVCRGAIAGTVATLRGAIARAEGVATQ